VVFSRSARVNIFKNSACFVNHNAPGAGRLRPISHCLKADPDYGNCVVATQKIPFDEVEKNLASSCPAGFFSVNPQINQLK
jgi:hypothetical protein